LDPMPQIFSLGDAGEPRLASLPVRIERIPSRPLEWFLSR
jgi:hypothetical protein